MNLRNRRRRAAILTVLPIFVGAAGWALGWSSLLAVTQIQVVGIAIDSPLKSNTVATASGIKLGQSMARLNQRSVERQLNQISRIEDVDLVRKWPHKVVLVIKERKPILAVASGTRFVLVDSRSNEFATVAKAPAEVPVLTILGDQKSGLRTAVSVITALPRDIRSLVRQMQSSGSHGLQITLQGGAQVIWGSSEDLALKSKVLKTILSGEGASRFTTFNVSAPYAPTAS